MALARLAFLAGLLAWNPASAALAAPSARQGRPPQPMARPAPATQIPIPLARPADAPKTSFAGKVSVQSGVTYARPTGSPPLTLDLYTPPSGAKPLPLILFVHDGDWNSGDSRHAAAFADLPATLGALAARGYIVASLNYRLSRQAHFPAALQDVKAAIRWLRGQARSYGGDVTRLAVWGLGAGGQLAALAGVTCGVADFEPEGNPRLDAPSDCAEAVIDWYGPTDLQSLDKGAASDSPQALYLGCAPSACAPGMARLSSPLAFVSVGAPPFLIQHGMADTVVPVQQSQKLYDALKAEAVPAQLELYPDVGHDFSRNGAPDPATVSKAMATLTAFLTQIFADKPAPKITLKSRRR